MKSKEINIVPPEGYEIDKENSTFTCIKFKPIEKPFRELDCDISGYMITCKTQAFKDGIVKCSPLPKGPNPNIFATLKQAKSAMAMAQISQIIANDTRFGGPITDEEWKNGDLPKFCLERYKSERPVAGKLWTQYHFIAFHTLEQLRLFIKENKDLLKDYFMLGRERSK